MAKLDCHFHPGTPAAWICDDCQTQFGDKCIPAGRSRHWGLVGPKCLRCEGELRFLGTATDAKPFWQMLPHFFAYPSQGDALWVIGMAAVMSLLLLIGGPVSVFILFTIGSLIVKYGLTIIERRGRGETTPPQFHSLIQANEDNLFWRFLGLFFLMFAAVYYLSGVNQSLGMLVSVFFTLATPACIIILAVDKEVSRALNPAAIVTLMTAVGWPYLLLWVCAQVVWGAPFLALNLLGELLPGVLILPALGATVAYATFSMYAMLGYVLFQYQDELGYEAGLAEDEELMTKADFEKGRAMGEATVFIRDGKYTEARESLRRALDVVRDDVDLHMHYHKLLMLMDDDTALANHGDYLLDLLDREQQLGRGVPVVLDVQSRVPGFRLKHTDTALKLAELLQMQGKHRAVLRLFHNLHKARPKDKLIPAAYLMVAKVFVEYMNEDTKARSVIDFVLKKFPDCKERGELLQLRDVAAQASPTA